MKLKNKKTGEIVEVESLTVDTPTEGIVSIPSFDRKGSYSSLAELNEVWEDYEEPKEYWTIDWACTGVTTNKYSGDDIDDFNKSIGNYFKTKEEAEKAVEKLKAWKRLNNCGLKFIDWWLSKDNHVIIGTNRQIFDIDEQGLRKDLDLLFGGEE